MSILITEWIKKTKFNHYSTIDYSRHSATELSQWCSANSKDEWEIDMIRFNHSEQTIGDPGHLWSWIVLFESGIDCTWFILRWSK